MAISRVGSNSAEATTVAFPANHQLGDIALIFAFRDGSATNPTIPAGWNGISNTDDGTTCSASTGWKIVSSTSDTSGTWTNATHLQLVVYRGVDSITPFGTKIVRSNTTSPSSYGATNGLTGTRMSNQWIVSFQGHRSIDTTTMNSAPDGETNLQYLTGATCDSVSSDSNGIVQAGTSANTNIAPGGTASGWITIRFVIYPAMQRFNNYRSARSISAGVISVGEKIR